MIAQIARAKHVERDFHVARGWTVEHARKQIHFPSKIHLHAVVHISLLKNKREKRKKEKQADTFERAEKIEVALPTAFNPARSCRIRPLATNMLRKRKNTGFWYIRQYIYINRNGLVHVLVRSSLYGDCSCTRREDWREGETIARKVAQSGDDPARRWRVPNGWYRWST